MFSETKIVEVYDDCGFPSDIDVVNISVVNTDVV
jgi:hypothetical protein